MMSSLLRFFFFTYFFPGLGTTHCRPGNLTVEGGLELRSNNEIIFPSSEVQLLMLSLCMFIHFQVRECILPFHEIWIIQYRITLFDG